MLARLLAAIDRRELPPSEWLRAGWPRIVLLLGVVAPALLAGPIRYVTGAGFGVAFALGALVSLAFLAPFVRVLARSGSSWPRELVTSAVVAGIAVFAAALVYNRHFHGLASYRTPDEMEAVDGAYHIANYMDFRRMPEVYQGCVALYSLWEAARRLGSKHLLIAVNAGFMLGRIVTAIAPLVIAFALLHSFRTARAAWWSGVAVATVAAFYLQYALVLPVELSPTMGGFWPHLFAVVPLMLIWMIDALVRQPTLRVLGLAAGVVLYRYTYALNLGDLLLAFGGLLVVEALGRTRWRTAVRVLFVLGAAAAAFLSWRCYTLIREEFGLWGWIVAHEVMTAWVGMLVAIAALAVPLLARPARETVAGSGLGRAIRFPIAFGLGSAFYVHVIDKVPNKMQYYFQKWDFHAVVLLAGALVVLATFWTAALVARARPPALIAGALSLVLGAGAVVTLERAFASKQEGFREQVFDGPYVRSFPWVMPATVAMIDHTLKHEHAAFGGYLSKQYPMFLFTNALFGIYDRDWFHAPKLHRDTGYCIFWDHDRFPRFDVLPEKQCKSYVQEPWHRLEVCHACY